MPIDAVDPSLKAQWLEELAALRLQILELKQPGLLHLGEHLFCQILQAHSPVLFRMIRQQCRQNVYQWSVAVEVVLEVQEGADERAGLGLSDAHRE